MTPVLSQLHRAALAAVSWAENTSALVKTPQAAKVLGAARLLLARVELLVEQEKARG